MAIHKLSQRKVDTAKAGQQYEDGGGLRLIVSGKGAKRWVLRVTYAGKRREMGLGSYPEISLSAARKDALKWRSTAKRGINPIEARLDEQEAREAAEQANNVPTFTSCAAAYISAHRRGWKNRKHSHQWVSTLKTYARPVIGDLPVDRIETEHILAILRPIWNSKTETAKRC